MRRLGVRIPQGAPIFSRIAKGDSNRRRRRRTGGKARPCGARQPPTRPGGRCRERRGSPVESLMARQSFPASRKVIRTGGIADGGRGRSSPFVPELNQDYAAISTTALGGKTPRVVHGIGGLLNGEAYCVRT